MSGLRPLIAWGVPLVLIVAHQTLAPRGASVWAGLPLELWIRLGWIVAAWVYLLWFTRVVWPPEGEAEGEPE